jgi:hypothetical protein
MIKSLRESNATWEVIGRALKKKASALKVFWSRYKAIEGLPPRTVIDKSITAVRVGAIIKRTIREDGFRSVRDITRIVVDELNRTRKPSSFKSNSVIVTHKFNFYVIIFDIINNPLKSQE